MARSRVAIEGQGVSKSFVLPTLFVRQAPTVVELL